MIKISLLQTDAKSQGSEYINGCLFQHPVSLHSRVVEFRKFINGEVFGISVRQLGISFRFLTEMPKLLKITLSSAFGMFLSKRNRLQSGVVRAAAMTSNCLVVSWFAFVFLLLLR